MEQLRIRRFRYGCIPEGSFWQFSIQMGDEMRKQNNRTSGGGRSAQNTARNIQTGTNCVANSFERGGAEGFLLVAILFTLVGIIVGAWKLLVLVFKILRACYRRVRSGRRAGVAGGRETETIRRYPHARSYARRNRRDARHERREPPQGRAPVVVVRTTMGQQRGPRHDHRGQYHERDEFQEREAFVEGEHVETRARASSEVEPPPWDAEPSDIDHTDIPDDVEAMLAEDAEAATLRDMHA